MKKYMNAQMHRSSTCHRRPRGFSLIEVMVAVLVLAIGLLGLAALQASSLRANHDAQLRTQATLLAYDMADRMRANREAALAGTNPYVASYEETACVQGFFPDSGGIPSRDIAEWRNQLACYLPLGEGQITRNGDVYVISVRWNEREDDDPDNLRTFSIQTRLR